MERARPARPQELAAACMDLIALAGGAGVALGAVLARVDPGDDRQVRAQVWRLLRRQRRVLRFFVERRVAVKREAVLARAGDAQAQPERTGKKRKRPADRAADADDHLRPTLAAVKNEVAVGAAATNLPGPNATEGDSAIGEDGATQEEMEGTEQADSGPTTQLEREHIPEAVVEAMPYERLVGDDTAAETAATDADARATEASGAAAERVVVVASDELRHRALNIPIKAIVADLGDDHFRILEEVGRAREAGMTITDLANLGQDNAIKKLHNSLDTLISYGLVVKRMLIVSRPVMRRMNIVHLPRFADDFSPRMFDDSAEFESDEQSKRILADAAEAYLKTLPNQSSVLTDLGRDLNLQKRHLELLRSHIIQETKRDENCPLELFQAVLQPSKRTSLEPKILNCVRYRQRHDPGDNAEPRRGISVELGLLNQIYSLIEDSGSHGATIVELRNQIVLPGSKLPYKLVSVLAGTYGLRAETIILGKNKAFRLFVDADAMANTSKTVGEDASGASCLHEHQMNGLPSDAFAGDENGSSTTTSKLDESPKPDAVFTIRANKALKISLGGSEIDATLELRRRHILERLEREKIISLSSLRASVFGMERAMGNGSTADRAGWESRVLSSHFSSASMGAIGVVDTRSILRIANDLETEKRLRLLQLPLPARNVSTKFRALRCVVFPGYEHNQRFIKNFVQNYCRDERLRRIQQNADKSQVVRIDSVGSDENDLASDLGFVSSDTSRHELTKSMTPTPTTKGDAVAGSKSEAYSPDEAVESALVANGNQVANGTACQPPPLEISYRIRRFVSQKQSGIHNQQYRKLGFAYGVMYRCKALHRYIWTFLHQGGPEAHSPPQVPRAESIVQPPAATTTSAREDTDPAQHPAKTHQSSPRPSKGIIFSREEVLHAMPIYLYIQVFSGGAILSASEFAAVEEAVEKQWLFGALPAPLREKIWSNESERTSKVLGTLADLELVVPYQIGMKNLAKILQAGYTDGRDGALTQALKDNALGGLFRLNNHIRIYLDDSDSDDGPFSSPIGARPQGTAPRSVNDLPSLKLVGVTEKEYSFTESIPLQFELKSADDIDRYWEALECLCLEEMVMEVPKPRRNEPTVCEVPKPAKTRAKRMMRILAWIPKSQKLIPRKAIVDKQGGIVSTARRSRKRKLSMMSGDTGAEDDSANEREYQLQKIALRKEKKAKHKAQVRGVGDNSRAALTWTESDEHRLIELFIDNCKSRWRVPIPQGLQQGREEVAFRNHTVTRSGFGLVALARKLNKRTIDVKKRLKERLLEPVVKQRFEEAKHEAMVAHHRQSTAFDEEVTILRSTRMTALFRRAVMIIVSPVQEYHPLVAEELISHWTASEIRTVWRYMWLRNWIVRATEKERGRGYSMSQRLQDSLKVTTLSYPLVLFRQAAEQASVVTSALEEIPFENYNGERDTGGVDGRHLLISSADQAYEEEFPSNASPGRCALELVSLTIGTSSMVAHHTSFAEMEKTADYEDDDDEGDGVPDDGGTGDATPEGKDNDQLLSSKAFRGGLGFASHLAKHVSSNKASVLLDSWYVETQMRGVSADKETLHELEAFSLESDEDNDGLGAVAFRPFKRRKKFQEALEEVVVRIVKASGEEGLTLSVLMERLRTATADVNGRADGDDNTGGWHSELRSTSIGRVGRCINTLVDAGVVLCVNAYFEQRYVVKEHSDLWLLRPFSLMPSTGKKSRPRVLFEDEKDTLSFPWLKMDGSTNYRFLFEIQRKLLMVILQSPGVAEDKVYLKMGRLLTLQDTREALSLLVEEGLVYTRASTVSRSPQSLFGGPPAHATTRVVNLVGNVLTYDRSVFTVHYFPHVECIQRFGGIVQDHQGEATLHDDRAVLQPDSPA